MTPYGWNITETAKHDSPAELECEPDCPVCGLIDLRWDENKLCWWCCACYAEFNAELIEIEDGEE
jgi:hypothetical protein